MYKQEGLHDTYYMLLYGCTMMLAVVAAVYLLWRRDNAVHDEVEPPMTLRRWAAAFCMATALSHVWWLVQGAAWLTDDLLLCNVVCETLDYLSFIPLIMITLVCMLQDCRRPLWPWFLGLMPVVAIAVWGMATRNPLVESLMSAWVIAHAVVFFTYLVLALRQYGRWLHDNFADLEHKELWQSFVLMALVAFFYAFYCLDEGGIVSEYLVQVDNIVIVLLLVWRVETLQDLGSPSPQPLPADDTTAIAHLLRDRCEAPGLYLRSGVTLADLSAAVGISSGALGEWFVQHGDRNFYAYIHRLRIDHFVRLYHEAVSAGRPFTVFSLARECGYRSYLAFTTAFRRRMGRSLTEWRRNQTQNNNI